MSNEIDLYGPTKELVGPSGKKFKIRSQNGADDDLISDGTMSKDQVGFHTFLCSLVIDTDVFGQGKRLTLENIGKLLVKDKYFLMIASRIHSIGNILDFQYRWPKTNNTVNYSEDLNDFIWDYSKSFPFEEDDEGYNVLRMKPYPFDEIDPYSDITHTLQSGKEVKFHLLNLDSENQLLNKGESIKKNDELIASGLQLKDQDGSWIPVKNFQFFTKKDMVELRSLSTKLERPFMGMSQLENPVNNEAILYPLMADPAFFFPLET